MSGRLEVGKSVGRGVEREYAVHDRSDAVVGQKGVQGEEIVAGTDVDTGERGILADQREEALGRRP